MLAIDDIVYEFNKRFLLVLSTEDNAVLLDPNEATVTIEDNDQGMLMSEYSYYVLS